MQMELALNQEDDAILAFNNSSFNKTAHSRSIATQKQPTPIPVISIPNSKMISPTRITSQDNTKVDFAKLEKKAKKMLHSQLPISPKLTPVSKG